MESIVWGWSARGIGHRGMISWLSARENRAAARAGRLSLPGLAVFVVSGMAAHRLDGAVSSREGGWQLRALLTRWGQQDPADFDLTRRKRPHL